MSSYISGKQLCKKHKFQAIELLTHISETGLQPRSITGQPIPPPDVVKIKQVQMGIDLDNPQKNSVISLSLNPTVCLEEIENERGNLDTWEGFGFENCIGGLIFHEAEKMTIINRLASDEVLFSVNEVGEKAKAQKKKKPRQLYTEHNQAIKLKCQKFAYRAWHEDRMRLTVDEMADLTLEKGIATKPNGKEYKFETIKEWISGIKTGSKKPPFTI